MNNELRLIQDCYSGLGNRANLPPAFFGYHLPYWRNSIMSPIFLQKKTLSCLDLVELEKKFKSYPKRNAHDQKNVYFQIIEDKSVYNLKQIALIASQQGWRESKSSTINVWKNKTSFNLPKGFYFTAGEYSSSYLKNDFKKLMWLAFGSNEKFLWHLERGIKSSKPNTHITLIYNHKNQIAAGGLVTIGSNAAFLWCGGVAPKFRKRGLWYNLVSLRQLVSEMYGAKYWVCSTSNKFILGKSDLNYNIIEYRKC